MDLPDYAKDSSAGDLSEAMQKHLYFIFLVLISFHAFAQKDSTKQKTFAYSYLAQGGFNPGFTVTYEKKLLTTDQYQVLLAGKGGLYFHYRNNTGVFLMVQSGQRFRLHKNFYFEHFLGVGFLETFLNGDAYYVNASGQVQKAGKVGNAHFMPSVSFGVSYDVKGLHKALIFIRPMIYWEIPFGQTSLVQYAFEIGTAIKLRK